jgi:CRP/FNR family cyclic AMP-dependent transcriptional regulator
MSNTANTSIFEAMRGIELFDGFDDEHLQQLAGISRLVEFHPLDTIFKEDEPAGDVYVIISGKVSLATCTPTVGCRKLMEIGDGELMGWSPMVGRIRLSDTARAITATSVVAINGSQLLALCGRHPELGFRFMHRAAVVLAQRLQATRLQLLEMSGHRLPEFAIESD